MRTHSIGAWILLFLPMLGGCLPLSSRPSPWDNLSREAKAILKKIDQHGKVEGKYLGRNPKPSEQYVRFEELMKITSGEDLKNLDSHPSPVLRAYAFWGLGKKKAKGIDKLLEAQMKTNLRLDVLLGDTQQEMNLADFLLKLFGTADIDAKMLKLDKATIDQLKALREN